MEIVYDTSQWKFRCDDVGPNWGDCRKSYCRGRRKKQASESQGGGTERSPAGVGGCVPTLETQAWQVTISSYTCRVRLTKKGKQLRSA